MVNFDVISIFRQMKGCVSNIDETAECVFFGKAGKQLPGESKTKPKRFRSSLVHLQKLNSFQNGKSL